MLWKQHQVAAQSVLVNGNRRVVVESVEKYPIKLSPEVIWPCGGYEKLDLVVRYVREVAA